MYGFQDAEDDPNDKMTILGDDRVEVFLWPQRRSAACREEMDDKKENTTDGEPDSPDCPYHAYEVNSAGRALDCRANFNRKFDFAWKGAAESSSGPIIEDADVEKSDEGKHTNINYFKYHYMAVNIPWSDLQLEAAELPKVCIEVNVCIGKAVAKLPIKSLSGQVSWTRTVIK